MTRFKGARRAKSDASLEKTEAYIKYAMREGRLSVDDPPWFPPLSCSLIPHLPSSDT